MFNLINTIFNFLMYIFSIFAIFVSTYIYLIDNNKTFTYLDSFLSKVYSNYYVIPIFLVVYCMIKTLAFIERLFEKEKDYKVKLKKGEITVKAETLNTFVKNYLMKNTLVESAKVNSKGRRGKVIINCRIYTYDISKISERLSGLREELSSEVEEKLMLKVSGVNIIIQNIKKSEKIKNIVEENDKKIEEIKVENENHYESKEENLENETKGN